MSPTQQPHYRERLWPSVGVVLFSLLMIDSVGIAFGYMWGFQRGVQLAVGLTVAAAIGTVLYTVDISTEDSGLKVGPALLPWEFVGDVHLLDKAATIRARSTEAHPSAYFAVRSWIPQSVIIQVDDVNDPHPYWHLSTRQPQALVNAIQWHKHQETS